MKPTRRPPVAKGGSDESEAGEGRGGVLVFHNRVEVFRRSSEGWFCFFCWCFLSVWVGDFFRLWLEYQCQTDTQESRGGQRSKKKEGRGKDEERSVGS